MKQNIIYSVVVLAMGAAFALSIMNYYKQQSINLRLTETETKVNQIITFLNQVVQQNQQNAPAK